MTDASETVGPAGIERRRHLSIDEFRRDFGDPGRPVLLSGAADAWPALTAWTFGALRTRLKGRHFVVARESRPFQRILDDALASTEEAPAPYLHNINIIADLPELLPDVQPGVPYATPNRLAIRWPQLLLYPERDRYLQLFIGGAGSGFPWLHWDSPPFQTFSTCVRGRKAWVLFPPDQTPWLYPDPATPSKSLVHDVHHPDLDRFPLVARARGLTVTQEAGETLFIPSGWWHTTRNLEPTISVATDYLGPASWPPYVEHAVSRVQRRFPWRFGLPARLARAWLRSLGWAWRLVE